MPTAPPYLLGSNDDQHTLAAAVRWPYGQAAEDFPIARAPAFSLMTRRPCRYRELRQFHVIIPKLRQIGVSLLDICEFWNG